jgi:hypothetical protein
MKQRGASPTKMFKKKHAGHSGSAPPPSTGKPHPPSRLGRPPINKAHSASPYSPDKDKDKDKSSAAAFRKREGSVASTASVQSARPRSQTPNVNASSKTVPGKAGNKTDPGTQKTLPGGSGTPPVSGQVQDNGDDSSEADDDY